MCCSATASFVTAGLTGTIGVIAVGQATDPCEWPLASVPIFFAMQQSIEGLLWLDLSSGRAATGLPLLFLLFAEVFWPVYVPVSILFVEPKARRRQLIFLCLAVGLGVSAYLLQWILTHAHGATIINDHIVYYTEDRHSDALAVAYLAATTLPGMLSSRRTLLLLGSIIFVGSAVAYAFYWETFVSVWCFFCGGGERSDSGSFRMVAFAAATHGRGMT